MGVEAWFLSWRWFEDNRVICREQPELWLSSFKTSDLPSLSAKTVYSSSLMMLISVKMSITLFIYLYHGHCLLHSISCSHGNCMFWSCFKHACASWESRGSYAATLFLYVIKLYLLCLYLMQGSWTLGTVIAENGASWRKKAFWRLVWVVRHEQKLLTTQLSQLSGT